MATAVSGTGPTYVFLVMEALIDAAVHLGFPRHVAHDLVIETLEGSTVFAKQSGMHPAELRNMVTSPGGTSAAALHELESGRLRTVLSEAVWAAYRRTVELGEQLEASVGVEEAGQGPHDVSLVGVAPAIDLRRAPLAELRAVDMRAPERDFWADEVALWDRLVSTWAGLDDAAWRIPGASTVRRRRAGLVPRRARRPSRRLAGARRGLHAERASRPAAGRRTRTSTAATSTSSTSASASPGGRCRATRSWPAWRRRGAALLRQANRLTASAIRGDDAWGWVYLALHGHYLDHLAVIETWTGALRARQADGDPFVADPRGPGPRHASWPATSWSNATLEALLAVGAVRPLGDRRGHPRLDDPRPRRAPGRLGRGGRPRHRGLPPRAPLAGRPRRGRRRLERADGRALATGRTPWPTLARYERARAAMHDAVATLTWPSCGRRTAGAGPTTASTGTSASTWRSLGRGALQRPGRIPWPDARDRRDRRRPG